MEVRVALTEVEEGSEAEVKAEVELTSAACIFKCLRRVSLFSKYVLVTQTGGQRNPWK